MSGKSKSLSDILLETIIGGEVSGLSTINGLCVACVGSLAKNTLSSALENASLVRYFIVFEILLGNLGLFGCIYKSTINVS